LLAVRRTGAKASAADQAFRRWKDAWIFE
jgi:hypothetical protein